jgi:ribonuclease Z
VDLLIHEVCMVNEQALAANPGFQDIVAHHITASDAGRVFSQAKPKLAVFSHLVFLSDTNFPRPSVEALLEQTRKTYGGPLVVGQDLMAFEISDDVKQLPSVAR